MHPGQLNILNDFGATPPELAWETIEQALAQNEAASEQAIKNLASYEVAPPAAVWQNIQQKLQPTATKSSGSQSPAKVVSLSTRKIAAWVAAAAVVIMGGFIVYKYSNPTPALTPATPETVQTLPEPNIETPTQEQLPAAAPVSARHREGKRVVAVKRNFGFAQESNDGDIPFSIFEIENEDEFFVVLAGYIAKNEASLDPQKKLKLRVDEYTTIYFSPKLQAFMRNMYDVNRRGNPSAKARQHFRKFRRWKKAVRSAFESKEANIVDPFTLANFLNDNYKL